MSKLTVNTLGPGELPEWDEFVARSPDGCVYAEAAYLESLTAATGARFRVLGASGAGSDRQARCDERCDREEGGFLLHGRHRGVGGRKPRIIGAPLY